VDSVCIGLTSSNRVTFAGNSTGLGAACQPTCSGWLTIERRDHHLTARADTPPLGAMREKRHNRVRPRFITD
jgi:hypothetical protein